MNCLNIELLWNFQNSYRVKSLILTIKDSTIIMNYLNIRLLWVVNHVRHNLNQNIKVGR